MHVTSCCDNRRMFRESDVRRKSIVTLALSHDSRETVVGYFAQIGPCSRTRPPSRLWTVTSGLTQFRTCRTSRPGAQFTKYLAIYRKINVSVS